MSGCYQSVFSTLESHVSGVLRVVIGPETENGSIKKKIGMHYILIMI
jgi:hypothetical protein